MTHCFGATQTVLVWKSGDLRHGEGRTGSSCEDGAVCQGCNAPEVLRVALFGALGNSPCPLQAGDDAYRGSGVRRVLSPAGRNENAIEKGVAFPLLTSQGFCGRIQRAGFRGSGYAGRDSEGEGFHGRTEGCLFWEFSLLY